jgi:glycosyltransferase involved in cell wall biosynthesis
MDLVFVGDRCNDHSPSSGYDQVCSLFPDASWLSGRALEAGRLQWHRSPKGFATWPRVFHVIYGDCSGKELPELLRKQFPDSRIVSSAHRPVSRLAEERVACDALRASDAIIAVSEVQALELMDFGFSTPIYTIPHGVWTRVFRPAPTPSGQRLEEVLLVGSFLRDWNGAKHVVDLLAQSGVRSLALGAGARDHLVGDGLHFKVLPRVSEAELAQLYHRAAAVFLPFLDATASNALLEAMSAGCPVICPRLPALLDYLGDDVDTFEPGRYDIAAGRILRYVRDSIQRDARARALITHAQRFDWSCVKESYCKAYAAIACANAPGTPDWLPAWDTISLGSARDSKSGPRINCKCGSS